MRVNHLSILAIIIGLVGTLTAWSVINQPTATLIANLPHDDRYEYHLGDDEAGTSWWHVRCQIDPQSSSPLQLHALDPQGHGHVLHWDPNALLWRLVSVGERPILLGQGRLEVLPRHLSLIRHGFRFELRAGGQRLVRGYDLSGPPPANSWKLLSEHGSGSTVVEVHNHAYLAAGASQDTEIFHEVLDLLESFKNERHNHVTLHRQANRYIDYFQNREPEHSPAHLWPWIMWAQGSGLINDGFVGDSWDAVLTFIENTAHSEERICVIPGLLMDLQRHICQQAAIIPEHPVRTSRLLNRRTLWMEAVLKVSALLTELSEHSAAAERGHVLSRFDRNLVVLTAQFARVLSGESVGSTPAEVPSWVSARIRILSGRDPQEHPLPEVPRSWFGNEWLLSSFNHLNELIGGFEPPSAINLRVRILETINNDPQPEAALKDLLEKSQADPRIRIISAGLLSLHGSLPIQIGLDYLTQADADGISLIERDPLAYAIYRLILHRKGQPPEGEQPVPSWGLPPGLTPYRQLLDGGFGATTIAFSRPGGTIPPPEALASALAMQEVSGIPPEWHLLTAMPSLRLPLSLIIPPPPQPVPTFTVPE
ncbi:MAG: hypothetical protein EA401_08835 [Planctomycetota bacterium]|nr:MAG: hypothetical protein EA401_08835 [Planctomycetota bacterium]